MIRIVWSDDALNDLNRVYRFLAEVNPRAALELVDALVAAPERLVIHPRLGLRHEGMELEEVRRLIVNKYEMRYRLLNDEIAILRIFHAKEQRN